MRTERLLLGLVASTFAAFALACSSGAADDSGQDEGATVVEPNGVDNPGKLTVSGTNAALDATTFKVDNAPASKTLGQVVEGLHVGSHSVSVETRGPTYSVTTSANVAVSAGQTTTVTPAWVKVDARTMKRTLGLGNDKLGPITVTIGAPLGTIAPTADGSTAMAAIGGSFEVRFGLMSADGISVSPQSGSTQQVTLSGNDGRRIARLQAPASRDMPPADCASISETYTLSTNKGFMTAPIALAPGETIDFGAAPNEQSATYNLQAHAWSTSVQIPLGERGAGPRVTALGRIDVDDVLINSTQPRVKGRYQIFSANADGTAKGGPILACSPSTKTGVDLLPGKYRVEVSYATAEAGTKVDVHVVDVN